MPDLSGVKSDNAQSIKQSAPSDEAWTRPEESRYAGRPGVYTPPESLPSAGRGMADELDSIAEHELAKQPAAARIVRNVATYLRSATTGSKDYESRWLMRRADGDEWETASVYTEAEISSKQWHSSPIRRLPATDRRREDV